MHCINKSCFMPLNLIENQVSFFWHLGYIAWTNFLATPYRCCTEIQSRSHRSQGMVKLVTLSNMPTINWQFFSLN